MDRDEESRSLPAGGAGTGAPSQKTAPTPPGRSVPHPKARASHPVTLFLLGASLLSGLLLMDWVRSSQHCGTPPQNAPFDHALTLSPSAAPGIPMPTTPSRAASQSMGEASPAPLYGQVLGAENDDVSATIQAGSDLETGTDDLVPYEAPQREPAAPVIQTAPAAPAARPAFPVPHLNGFSHVLRIAAAKGVSPSGLRLYGLNESITSQPLAAGWFWGCRAQPAFAAPGDGGGPQAARQAFATPGDGGGAKPAREAFAAPGDGGVMRPSCTSCR